MTAMATQANRDDRAHLRLHTFLACSRSLSEQSVVWMTTCDRLATTYVKLRHGS
jgi:hypothetical protein